MNDERLEQLLQRVDRAAGGPAPPAGDLPRGVRSAAGRRRTRRLGSAAAGVVLLAGACVLWWSLAQPPAAPGPANGRAMQDLAAMEARIERLLTEVDDRIAHIRKLMAEEQEQRRQLSAMRVPTEVENQVERAAFITVHYADRLYRELGQTQSAVESYRRTIELFPRTRSANVARRRLAEIERTRQPQGERL